MDTRIARSIEWIICPCGREFPRRKKKGSMRKGGKNLNLRPFNSKTCCKRCSQELNHKIKKTKV
jgi:hypothetical protein